MNNLFLFVSLFSLLTPTEPLVSIPPSCPLHRPLHTHSTLLFLSPQPRSLSLTRHLSPLCHAFSPLFPSLSHPPRYASIPSWQLHLPPAPRLHPSSPPAPWLVSTAVVSEGQMTGDLAPGRALSHPGAIRLVANNRCFRPGEDQSGGITGNVRSRAFYTSAQMDEITLVSF